MHQSSIRELGQTAFRDAFWSCLKGACIRDLRQKDWSTWPACPVKSKWRCTSGRNVTTSPHAYFFLADVVDVSTYQRQALASAVCLAKLKNATNCWLLQPQNFTATGCRWISQRQFEISGTAMSVPAHCFTYTVLGESQTSQNMLLQSKLKSAYRFG